MLIPKDNEKDLADIPETVTGRLEIVPVSTVDEVLEHALTEALVPIEWNEGDAETQAVPAAGEEDGHSGVITH